MTVDGGGIGAVADVAGSIAGRFCGRDACHRIAVPVPVNLGRCPFRPGSRQDPGEEMPRKFCNLPDSRCLA